jgi:hypothetical protein
MFVWLVVDINSLFIIFFIEPLSVEFLRETKKDKRAQRRRFKS